MTGKHSTQSSQRDYGFIAIVTLVAITAIWLLLMPIVPAIASATLHRFHLRSESFATWALQQPIPSMYNFANRFEVRDRHPGLADSNANATETRYINHFPARVMTFANRRYRYLDQGKDRWFTIESSYRGQTLESWFHAKAKEGGHGFELIQLPSPDLPPGRSH
jgi:hypothetical protein